jgi:Fe-S cluster assembly protein SufD
MEQSPDRVTAWHWRDMSGSLIIHVPEGVIIDKPVIVEERLIGKSGAGAAVPHLHVHSEKSSSLSAIWSFEGAPDKTTLPLVNAGLTTEIDDNAKLDITVRQNLGTGVSFFLHDRMEVGRDARLLFRETHLGATLVKTQARVILNGEGADARLSGLYVSGDSCHLDIGTIQEHRSPRATSFALYKGAVNPGGRTIHRGLIVVSPHAAKTDAYLTNNNLILGDGARADSIPQLNILTDDVKCSHGSTTGKLDQAQLFYLQSRGFSPEEAVKELTRGFLAQVLTGAPEAVSEILSGDLDAALNFSGG